MDYGITCYQVGDGPIAQRMGARWAHTFCDLTEEIPDHAELFADADAHGCAPIADVRTTMAALGKMIAGRDDPVAARDAAIRSFAETIVRYLDRHETVRTIEVWSGAECVTFLHGRGEMLDYATVLTQVYDHVKAARPDVRVLSGGFGCARGATADLSMLENALAEYCPDKFDGCNLHPFLISTGYLDIDANTLRHRLRHAREVLDKRCKGQPLVATGFGVPTLDVPRPPTGYGTFRKAFGVRMIIEEEGAGWWLPLLDVLRACGMEFVCVLARDVVPTIWSHHFGGLCRADGTEKAFAAEVIEAIAQDAL